VIDFDLTCIIIIIINELAGIVSKFRLNAGDDQVFAKVRSLLSQLIL
jgi:hypothetical protein